MQDPAQPASSKERILRLLLERSELSARQAAEALGLTEVAIRAQLRQLENDEIVEHRRERQAAGRPLHMYRLRPDAHRSLPNGYRNFAIELVQLLKDCLPADEIRKVLEERNRQKLDEHLPEPTQAGSIRDRVEHLAKVRSDEGYLAKVEARCNGQVILEQCHCMLQEAAHEMPLLCESERAFFEDMTGAKVVQIKSRRAGDPSCAWSFRKPEASEG
jgi:predicted ArsR family transcriptional regulator